MLKNVLLQFYKYEMHVFISWSILTVVAKYLDLNINWLVLLLAADLSFFYVLYDKVIIDDVKDSNVVLLFPKIYGISVALLVIGISLQLFLNEQNFLSSLGMFGVLISCMMLFNHSVQDKFMPLLKEFLLRTILILFLGILHAL